MSHPWITTQTITNNNYLLLFTNVTLGSFMSFSESDTFFVFLLVVTVIQVMIIPMIVIQMTVWILKNCLEGR